MENTNNELNAKPTPFRSLWPDVKTEKGRSEAIKAGAIALVYVAVSYAIVIALVVTTGQDLMGAMANEMELVITLAFNVAAIVIASLMAWFLYKRQSLIIACIGLAWILLEVAIKVVAAPGSGIVVAILALLFSINGVRGALAAKKASQPSVEA